MRSAFSLQLVIRFCFPLHLVNATSLNFQSPPKMLMGFHLAIVNEVHLNNLTTKAPHTQFRSHLDPAILN